MIRAKISVVATTLLISCSLLAVEKEGLISDFKAQQRSFTLSEEQYQIARDVKITSEGLGSKTFPISILRDGTKVKISYQSSIERRVKKIKILVQ